MLTQGWRARQDAARNKLEYRRKQLHFNDEIRSQRALAIAHARGELVDEPSPSVDEVPIVTDSSKDLESPQVVVEAQSAPLPQEEDEAQTAKRRGRPPKSAE